MFCVPASHSISRRLFKQMIHLLGFVFWSVAGLLANRSLILATRSYEPARAAEDAPSPNCGDGHGRTERMRWPLGWFVSCPVSVWIAIVSLRRATAQAEGNRCLVTIRGGGIWTQAPRFRRRVVESDQRVDTPGCLLRNVVLIRCGVGSSQSAIAVRVAPARDELAPNHSISPEGRRTTRLSCVPGSVQRGANHAGQSSL